MDPRRKYAAPYLVPQLLVIFGDNGSAKKICSALGASELGKEYQNALNAAYDVTLHLSITEDISGSVQDSPTMSVSRRVAKAAIL
ncbi:hypothetical protein AVEN_37862-1 [Araneus ventricosus]|uniref:Uncharacterized protein n=1 Tax=Araneus ventricosus TaxID=182803 RepID=A0A4Y2MDK8_ARAVE|nr:hypothetical protein AVEN_235818-1 [Araneus ventricosus]GBN25235.1 hypothetical protein AVEN_37862-1 [Araneus ventricosus]